MHSAVIFHQKAVTLSTSVHNPNYVNSLLEDPFKSANGRQTRHGNIINNSQLRRNIMRRLMSSEDYELAEHVRYKLAKSANIKSLTGVPYSSETMVQRQAWNL